MSPASRALVVVVVSGIAAAPAVAAAQLTAHVAAEAGIGGSLGGRYNPTFEQLSLRGAAAVGARSRRMLSLEAVIARTSGAPFGRWVTGLPDRRDGVPVTRVVAGRDPATGFTSTGLRVGIETPTEPVALRIAGGAGWMHGVDVGVSTFRVSGLAGGRRTRAMVGVEGAWFPLPVQDYAADLRGRRPNLTAPIAGTRRSVRTHETMLYLGVETRLGR